MPYDKTFVLPPLPVPPPPPPMTEATRIADLQRICDPQNPYYLGEQVQNLRKIISLYQSGEITLESDIIVQDGEVTTHEEAKKHPGRTNLREAYNKVQSGLQSGQQMMVKASYDNGQLGVGHHELRALMRLPHMFNASAHSIEIRFLNDTGSSCLSIYANERIYLNAASPHYYHCPSVTRIKIADGTCLVLPTFFVELRMLDLANNEWGPWFLEQAIEWSSSLGRDRLSGSNMRRQFFMGEGPVLGGHLGMALSKSGLNSLL